MRQLERDRDNGNVRRIGQRWTVESWLQHWLENIARPSIRDSSFNAYRVAVNKHLIPGLGKHRLELLEPEHLEKLYQRMIKSGARPGTAHQVHRTIRAALGQAQRRGHVSRNVPALAKPPRVQLEPVRPYSVDARADGDERHGVVERAPRYQHVTDPIRRDVTDRIGGLLWAERKGVDDAN